ncbi:MAG: DUF5710 domain-containing protein, partial [Deltaproteobacteria bacterium]|nr:DUF5710 domain-containing protein [Deltaproteobacteria bacterium]
LWPAQASKEDVLHDQPSEERIAEPPVEVKANLGAAKEKTFLEVPYAEKDQAKKLGAQWDRQKKSWFAPAGADLRRLGQWLPKEQSLADQSLDAAGELAKAITAMGGDLQGARPALNGKVHRLPAIDRPAGNKDFAYCAYADGLPAGWMQNHATGEKSNWKFSGGHELTEEQKLLLRSEADQQREARRREQDMARDAVAKDCAAYFADRSPAASEHPYLAAKGVEALGIKESETGRDLLVPLLNLKGEIRSLPRIHENGFKSFQAGAEKKGNFFLLGCEFNELARQKEVLIAEGYATAASLHMATRLPCVVAFGADNLMPAAENIRSLLPDAAIVICADNDHSHSMGNIGVLKAKAAAEKIKGRLIIPFLTPDERKAGCKDFNDIHQRRGLGAVKKQVEAGLGKSRSYESVLGF